MAALRKGKNGARAALTRIGAAVVATMLHARPCAADTWDNSSGDATWSNPINWQDNSEPTSADTAIFPAGFPNFDMSITLSSNEMALSLTLNDAYTLTGGNLTLASGNITVGNVPIAPIINSALIGSGGLRKLGLGPLTLGGANMFTGAISLDQGTLLINADSRLGNAANGVSINGGKLQTTATFSTSRTFTPTGSGGSIAPNAGTTLTLTSALAANANALAMNGSGTLALNATSARTGSTAISAGRLRVNNGAALGSGLITASLAGRLELGGVTVSQPMSLSLNGGIIASETSTYAGTITVGNGINPVVLGADSGTLVIGNEANDYTGGSGSNTVVSGTGLVVLPFANDYVGSWQLNNGMSLELHHASALGTGTTPVVVNDALLRIMSGITLARNLTLNDGAILIGTSGAAFTGVTSVTSGAAIDFATGSFFTVGDGANDLTGGGGGSTITISGGGIVTLAASSNYTGNWTVAAGGRLSAAADDRFGNLANTIDLSGELLVAGSFASARTITPGGGTISFANTTLTLSSGLAAGSGSLTLGTFGTSGKLILQAASARTGATTIGSLCEIELQHGTALGTAGAGGVTVNPGSVLRLTGVTLDKPVTLNHNAALRSTGNASSVGAMTIASGAGVFIRAEGGAADTLTLGNADNDITGGNASSHISVNSPTTFGGTILLPFSNNYIGGWSVQQMGLRIANATALGTGTSAIGVFGGGRLEIDGVTLNRALTLNTGATLRAVGAGASNGVATVAAAANVTLSGGDGASDGLTIGNAANDLTGGSGATVNVSGLGRVILPFSNDYTGAWQVNSGLLELQNATALGSGTSLVVINAGTLRLANVALARDLTLNNNARLEATGTASGTGTMSVTSGAAIVINSASTLTLGDGANDLTGGGGASNILVQGGGKVSLAQPSNYAGNWTVSGTLEFNADDRLGNAANNVTISGGTLSSLATFSTARTITPGGNLSVQSGTTLTLTSGLGAGTGALTKAGVGTLILQGASSRTGSTTVTTGRLQLESGTALGAVAAGGVTMFGGTLTLAGVTVDKPLTLNSGSVLDSIAASTWAGTTTVQSGTLTVTLRTVGTSSTLTMGDAPNDLTGGTSTTTINADGTGTLILPHPSNYAGGWQVSNGTVRIHNAASLGSGSSAVAIGIGGVLELSNMTLNRAITLNQAAGLRGAGAASSIGTMSVASNAVIFFETVNLTDTLSLGDAANDLANGGGDSMIVVKGPGTVTAAQPSFYSGAWYLEGCIADRRERSPRQRRQWHQVHRRNAAHDRQRGGGDAEHRGHQQRHLRQQRL